jgi:aspartate-semialdehyde dehydrogenase
VDELQEQTVSLLNFQDVGKKVFKAQLAFNILPEDEASALTERRIMEQLDGIFGKTFPKPTITAVQVPVFHSHAFSMFVNVRAETSEIAALLAKSAEFVSAPAPGGPSPISVVGSDKIHIGRLRPVVGGHSLWVVADNLRIAASNAIQTAEHIMLAPALEA